MVVIINYLDTASHTSFFIGFVLIVASILATSGYFVA